MGQLMIKTTGGYTYFVSLHNVREAIVLETDRGLSLFVNYFGETECGDYRGITNYTREDLEIEVKIEMSAQLKSLSNNGIKF